MPKTHSKPKAGKGKKPFKPPEAPKGPAYDIGTCLKHVLKTKAQPGEHLEYKNVVVYAPCIKSGKNKGSVCVLFMF